MFKLYFLISLLLIEYFFYQCTVNYNEILGEGSFGTVYMGTCRINGYNNTPVAYKCLKDNSKINVNDSEYQLTAYINKSNKSIVPNIYATTESCFIIEYFNCDLTKFIKILRDKNSNINKIEQYKTFFNIIYKIIVLVNNLHKLNVIHSDLKPENILVKYNWNNNVLHYELKLSDLGLSVSKSNSSHKSYIKNSTPMFAPPEELSKPEALPNFDVWSIGIIIYEILFGQDILTYYGSTTNGLHKFYNDVKNNHFSNLGINSLPNCLQFIKLFLNYIPTNRIDLNRIIDINEYNRVSNGCLNDKSNFYNNAIKKYK